MQHIDKQVAKQSSNADIKGRQRETDHIPGTLTQERVGGLRELSLKMMTEWEDIETLTNLTHDMLTRLGKKMTWEG